MSDLLSWSLSILAFAAIVVLTAVAATAVAGDPARGRRRCPRCWHELPPLGADADARDSARRLCGECGHVAPDERSTMRTRRAPMRAAIAILAVVAIIIALRERFMSQGPWAPAPTGVLVFVVPHIDGDAAQSAMSELRQRLLRGTLSAEQVAQLVEMVVASTDTVPGSREWELKYERLAGGLLSSIPRDDPLRGRFLEIPPRIDVAFLSGKEGRARVIALDLECWWPDAVEAAALVTSAETYRWSARFNPGGRSGALMIEAPDGLDPMQPLEIEIKVRPLGVQDDETWRVFPVAETAVPASLGRQPSEPDATPVDSAELRALVASVFSSQRGLMVWADGTPRAGLRFSEGVAAGDEFAHVLFGLRVEVCEDGVPRRTSRIWWFGGSASWPVRWLFPIEDQEALARLYAQDPAQDARWSLRISGDPTLADYARPPVAEHPDRTKFSYWSGTVELPLSVMRTAQTSPPRRWLLTEDARTPADPIGKDQP